MKQMNYIKRMKDLFHLLDDETRLSIVFALIDDSRCNCKCNTCEECIHLCCMIEMCVNDIANKINSEQSLVSHQLAVLKQGGILTSKKYGKQVFYSLCDGHIKQILKIAKAHVMEENDD